MPIFQDPDRVISSYRGGSPRFGEDDDNERQDPPASQKWKESELMDVDMGGTSPTDGGTVCHHPQEVHTSDRGELIQCIKRGQHPTWVPHRSVSAEDSIFLSCSSYGIRFLAESGCYKFTRPQTSHCGWVNGILHLVPWISF